MYVMTFGCDATLASAEKIYRQHTTVHHTVYAALSALHRRCDVIFLYFRSLLMPSYKTYVKLSFHSLSFFHPVNHAVVSYTIVISSRLLYSGK